MAFGRGKKWQIDHFIERPEVDGVTLTAVLKSVDGTETRTVHTGKQNERDARAFAQDWLVRLRRKPKIRHVKKLIREYADRCHQRGVRASTLEAYWQSLAPFARHVGEDLNIRRVKREDIEGYLLAAKACGRNGKPRSAASVNKIRRHLSAFFKWCRISGYMGIDPAEGASRFPETPKHSVEMTQRDAAAIDEELDQLVWKLPLYLWRFLWWSGVRLGSALELRWDMVNLESGELEIPPTSMKARRSFQVPLHPLCLEALREWNKEAAVEFDFPDDRPWGVVFPISRDRFRAAFMAACQKRFGRWGAFTIHSARALYQNYLRRSGVSLETYMQLLGHQSVQVAIKHYARVSMEDMRAALDKATGKAAG